MRKVFALNGSKHDLAGGDPPLFASGLKDKRAVRIKVFEDSAELTMGEANADRRADAFCAFKPCGSDRGKSVPAPNIVIGRKLRIDTRQ